jgi:poly(3-hydroxybutyrate) depolymerase
MSALVAAAALALLPGACVGPGNPYTPGVNCRVLEVDGHPRRFVAYVPRTRPARAPVVLMYHGSSGTGEQFLRISSWREQADATGLVAVFPTALRYRVLEGDRRWSRAGCERHSRRRGRSRRRSSSARSTKA